MYIYLHTMCTYATNYRSQWHDYICSHQTHAPTSTTDLSEICTDIFLDGYCSTVQGLLDWFEVDLGFTELSFIQIDLCVLCDADLSEICTYIYMQYEHMPWTTDLNDISTYIYTQYMNLCLLHISVTYVRIFTYDVHICHELQTSVTWVHLLTRNTCTYVYYRSQRHMNMYLTTICTYAANYRFQWHKYIYLHTTHEPMFTSYLSDICTHTHIRYVYMPRTTNLHDRSTYLYTQHMHLRLLQISVSCTRIFTYNMYICHELQMSDQGRYISFVTLYDRVREISLYERVREILHYIIEFVWFYAVWYSSWDFTSVT